jgi:hypothetical protein
MVGDSSVIQPRLLRKAFLSVIMPTAWWKWKHHDTAVFGNAQPSVASLFDMIKAEARLWAEAWARGIPLG